MIIQKVFAKLPLAPAFTVYVKDAFAAKQCVKAFPIEQGDVGFVNSRPVDLKGWGAVSSRKEEGARTRVEFASNVIAEVSRFNASMYLTSARPETATAHFRASNPASLMIMVVRSTHSPLLSTLSGELQNRFSIGEGKALPANCMQREHDPGFLARRLRRLTMVSVSIVELINIFSERNDQIMPLNYCAALNQQTAQNPLFGCREPQAVPPAIGNDPAAFHQCPFRRRTRRNSYGFLQTIKDRHHSSREFPNIHGLDEIGIGARFETINTIINRTASCHHNNSD